jgi:hypothetical protein
MRSRGSMADMLWNMKIGQIGLMLDGHGLGIDGRLIQRVGRREPNGLIEFKFIDSDAQMSIICTARVEKFRRRPCAGM